MNYYAHICLWGILLSLLTFSLCKMDRVEDVINQTKDMVVSYGFHFEKYEIVTEDSYILTTFRIRKDNTSSSSKPVLFVHGMYARCEEFLLLGRNKSVGFILAERGYDVWLMNARGTLYSKKHKFFDPKTDEDYWRFSWHEIGFYDIPANIDYILNETKNKNLFYLGHSQGGTTYYVLTSERPEYNRKIKASANLAPAVFWRQPEKSIVTDFAKNVHLLEVLRELLHWFELFPNVIEISQTLHHFCKLSLLTRDLCLTILGIVAGREPGFINRIRIPNMVERVFGGGSVFQIIHYLQNVNDGIFRQYDFGDNKNLEIYKNNSPPEYDVKKSSAPTISFHALDDFFAPKNLIEALSKEIPNGKTYLIEEACFSHFDFAGAENASTLVYEPLVEYFDTYK